MLFKNLRVHQVFGANTEVGKTVFTAALCRASAALGHKSFYLKPVGTGGQGDDWHVTTFAKNTETACLHYFHEPVSPHLAAQRATDTDKTYAPPSDETVSQGIKKHAERIAKGLFPSELASLYVETAGGPHSPTLSGRSQVDTYRPLRLPTVLIASHHLGGISTTLSAYESLLLRGYDIDAMLCFEETYYENYQYLSQWCKERDLAFGTLRPPQAPLADREADISGMHEYYDTITRSGSILEGITQQLVFKHNERLRDLETAAGRTLKTAWWPFVQHSLVKEEKDVMVIDSALNDSFSVYSAPSEDSGRNHLMDTFDGSASWWTQCLGHANVELTLAAAQAAGRYGHVIFPNATHAPALKLSETLVNTVGKGWADRAFFSDNGSTGMEVALKMALRYKAKQLSQKSGSAEKVELGALGLNGSYHGDTIGAMDACEGGVYSRSVEWYRGRGFWLDAPTVRVEDGKATVRFEGSQWAKDQEPLHFDSLHNVYDIEERLQPNDLTGLANTYRAHIKRWVKHAREELGINFGTLVLEPVVMGAGGQLFVDPLFQRILVDTVREDDSLDLPVIFDEVYIGLYRLGRLSGSSFLGLTPDIACYAKILTGGLLPLSVTLANDRIFESFLGSQKQEALLHGHSYTAHPIGCAVANKTLDIIAKHDADDTTWNNAKAAWRGTNTGLRSAQSQVFSLWDAEFVDRVSRLPGVDGAMTLGTVLVIYLRDTQNAGYQSTASVDFLKRLRCPRKGSDSLPIHARPLGNTVYWMSSLNTPAETLRKVEGSIWTALHPRASSRQKESSSIHRGNTKSPVS